MKFLKSSTDTQRSNTLEYGETVALSLLVYAKENDIFARVLKNHAKLHGGFSASIPNEERELDVPSIKIMMPADTQTAIRRLLWLNDNSEKISGGKKGIAALHNAKNIYAFENPKVVPFTVGVYRIAIPGITMGRYKKKERKIVVVRDDVMRSQKVSILTKNINKTCVSVIHQALLVAEGNLNKLEPEIGDWLSSDRQVSIYTTNKKNLKNVVKDLEQLGIIYSKEEDEDGVSVVAMSPAINSSSQFQCWNIRELTE